jgi:hypothetical protein
VLCVVRVPSTAHAYVEFVYSRSIDFVLCVMRLPMLVLFITNSDGYGHSYFADLCATKYYGSNIDT